MKKLKQQFLDSWHELKSIRTLVITSMLMAIAVVLGFYTLQLSEYLKIGFSFIANELVGMLFGPVVGGLMAGGADILKFLVKPTGPFFFGFTLNAILAGIIYGMFLYKRPISLKRIIMANATVSVLVNMLLATYYIAILYGTPFMVLFPVRAFKQLIMLPVEVMLYYVTAKALQRTNILSELRAEKANYKER
ncbi:MAG: folate family ECF transporter S component [Lachnospiraceae bacterium]